MIPRTSVKAGWSCKMPNISCCYNYKAPVCTNDGGNTTLPACFMMQHEKHIIDKFKHSSQVIQHSIMTTYIHIIQWGYVLTMCWYSTARPSQNLGGHTRTPHCALLWHRKLLAKNITNQKIFQIFLASRSFQLVAWLIITNCVTNRPKNRIVCVVLYDYCCY